MVNAPHTWSICAADLHIRGSADDRLIEGMRGGFLLAKSPLNLRLMAVLIGIDLYLLSSIDGTSGGWF